MNKLLYVVVLSILFASCSQYQKAVKSEDLALKSEVATKMYEAGKYEKAIHLFEQLSSVYKGRPQGESIFYMYSQALYKTKQYYLAGYQFDSYASLYPKSANAEEAAFLSSKSYAMLAPEYALDQVDTEKAIVKFQSFIDEHPNSIFLAESNTIVKSLTDRLETKAFENAKRYNTIFDYKAAIKAIDIFLGEFPGTQYKEKALFYKLNSSYQLAINSVQYKMLDRLNFAKAVHASLLKFSPNTEYKKTADEMLARIDKDLQQFSK